MRSTCSAACRSNMVPPRTRDRHPHARQLGVPQDRSQGSLRCLTYTPARVGELTADRTTGALVYFRYLGRELRRRARSAALVAIGLALGVGLVVTVTSYASGIKAAQGQVLSSLYGVGTDLTVTKPATAGSGGGFRFSGTPPSSAQAGQSFAQDNLTSAGGLTTISASDVSSISKLKGVAGA